MTDKCPHGTPLDEDCGKCREIIDAAKRSANACAFPNGFALGLTKREWFAGLAMQGVITSDSLHPDDVADFAVQQADRLLEELAK